LDRALTILHAAYAARTRHELARLPIGDRDALLFAFHAAHFGPWLEGQAHCPQCAAHVEVSLDLRDLPLPDLDSEPAHVLEVTTDGYTLTCRLPDSYDAAAVATALATATTGGADPSNEAPNVIQLLLERILVRAERASGADDVRVTAPVTQPTLPDSVRQAVAEFMEAAQPLADARLLVTCPTCGHTWSLVLDILDFVWARLDALAARLLAEVDALARTYGWRETDILALSPARRQAYLGMVRG
jgi:hypothetical protein